MFRYFVSSATKNELHNLSNLSKKICKSYGDRSVPFNGYVAKFCAYDRIKVVVSNNLYLRVQNLVENVDKLCWYIKSSNDKLKFVYSGYCRSAEIK